MYDYIFKNNINKRNVTKRVTKGNFFVVTRMMAHISFTILAFWPNFFSFISFYLLLDSISICLLLLENHSDIPLKVVRIL